MNLPEIEKIIQLFNKMSDMDIAILDADYRNLVHQSTSHFLNSICLFFNNFILIFFCSSLLFIKSFNLLKKFVKKEKLKRWAK